jgi:hypothetical protein
MKNTIKKIAVLVFIMYVRNVHALDLEITEKETETFIKLEYNRAFYNYIEAEAIGGIELNNLFTFRGGISLGRTDYDYDINTFINTGLSPFVKFPPLNFSLSYIYNGLPEYEAHTHSIMPLVSLITKRAGASFGGIFRFTSFFGGPAIFEALFSFYAYFNFITTDILTVGVGAGNYDDFHAKNLGAYSFSINAAIHQSENWSFISGIELMQSGGDGFTTTFYGIVCRMGVKFLW